MKNKNLNSIILPIITFLFFSIFFAANVRAEEEEVQANKPEDQNTVIANAVKDAILESKKHINSKIDEITKNNEKKILDLTEKNKLNIQNTFDSLYEKANSKFSIYNKKNNDTEKKINSGIASAVSLASIPYCNNKNSSFGIGLGIHKNGNAIGLGFQRKINDISNIRINVGWSTNNSFGIGAGLALGW